MATVAPTSSSARPSEDGGRVYLLSGKDGTVLRTYAPRRKRAILRMVRRPARRSRRRRPRRSRRRRAVRDERRGRAGRRRLGPLVGKRARSCSTGAERIAEAASAASWRRSATSTATARARSRWRRRQRRTRRATLPGRGSHLLRRHRQGAAALVGEASRASSTDGWSSPPAISTATASRTSPSARPGIVAMRATRSVGSSSAPEGAATVLGEFSGDEADCWFGWHIRRAPDPDGRGRPALADRLPAPSRRRQARRRRARPLRAAPREGRGRSGHEHARHAPQRHQVDAERAPVLPGERIEGGARGGALAVVTGDGVVEARGTAVVQVGRRIGDAPEPRREILARARPRAARAGRRWPSPCRGA